MMDLGLENGLMSFGPKPRHKLYKYPSFYFLVIHKKEGKFGRERTHFWYSRRKTLNSSQFFGNPQRVIECATRVGTEEMNEFWVSRILIYTISFFRVFFFCLCFFSRILNFVGIQLVWNEINSLKGESPNFQGFSFWNHLKSVPFLVPLNKMRVICTVAYNPLLYW